MRIKQAYVGVKFFKETFLKKFDLREYSNIKEPAIFFGLYRKQQRFLLEHKGPAIIVWAGSDILQHKEDFISFLKNREDTHFVAISEFIANDMRNLGITPFYNIPIIPHDNNNFTPQPLGNAIYIYYNLSRPGFYGEQHIAEIQKHFPTIKIIKATARSYPRNMIKSLYRQCFIGLRMTPHDGLSNTAVELGLMGRKIIWNGNTPNAINYNNITDVLLKIHKEFINRGSVNTDLAQKVKDFITISDVWLNTEFYTKSHKIH